jgi:hypothetical protein
MKCTVYMANENDMDGFTSGKSCKYKHLNIIIVCQNPTVQRPIQAEIQVHEVCPNVGNFVLIYTASKGDLIINKNYLSNNIHAH